MSKRLTYEFVKEYIEKEGYKLLSDSYVNNRTKILIECDKGHQYSVLFNSFKAGHRCLTCYINTCYNNRTNTYEYVKQFIDDEGYTLLSHTYKNRNTKLSIQCDKGHQYIAPFSYFQGGCRCPVCGGTQKLTYEYVKEYIESEGYVLLSNTYKNASTKLFVQCDKGHQYNVEWNNFKAGHRCPICFNESTSSKVEREIQGYVESLGIKTISNDRTQIYNKLTGNYLELDVWIPSLNKAIEYNGVYWHSFIDKIKRDKIKLEQCRIKGIDILVIDDQGWNNSKEVQFQRIREFLYD